MITTHETTLDTQGDCDIVLLTSEVEQVVAASGIQNGLAVVHCTGTTACVLMVEFEAGAMGDLKDKLEDFAPRYGEYKHHLRGVDDNGSAHVRSAFLNQNVTVPIVDARLALGSWQDLILIDLDTRPRSRTLITQLIGE